MNNLLQSITKPNGNTSISLLKSKYKQSLSNYSETSRLIEECVSADNIPVLEFILTNAIYENSDKREQMS